MKRIITALLTLAVIAALCVTAFAKDTYTLTINKSNSEHTYEVYQIFVGDLSESEEGKLVLSTVYWGSGVTEEGKTALGDAMVIAKSLDESTADAEQFAEDLIPYLAEKAEASYDAENECYTVSGLKAGYYLIKDKDNTLGETNQSYTSYILKVVGDVTADPKDGETTVEKKVDDTNDSKNAVNDIEWHDSADHDIGDLIDFKLEATLTDSLDDYESYFFAFHDTEEKGLTFKADSVKVYVDGSEITEGFELVTEDLEDGCTFEVVFEDVKAIAGVKAGSVIKVEYKSELNEDAIVGNRGNVNKVYGEFSNNPYNEEHGKTPDDTVIVFTYTTKVNKVDNENAPLSGAEFTLEKFVASENGSTTYKDVKGDWTALEQVVAEEGTQFIFRGLDDGYYRLTEDKAPVGYNKIDPIEFEVTAEHDILWNTQEREEVLTSLTGDVAMGEITFTASVESGEISTDIMNQKGFELPETGGIGTKIFYTAGIILVVAAGVFLITKKRMSKES